MNEPMAIVQTAIIQMRSNASGYPSRNPTDLLVVAATAWDMPVDDDLDDIEILCSIEPFSLVRRIRPQVDFGTRLIEIPDFEDVVET